MWGPAPMTARGGCDQNGRMPPESIRVLVADDHPVVRSGLVAMLATLPGVEVVGEAADGAEAIREASIARPDVVVMDLRMPRVDGVEATRRLHADHPEVAVLVLTMFDEDELVAAALAAGARGYVLKGATPDEIERALRAVASGAVILAPGVAPAVLGRLVPPRPAEAFPDLTPREGEILELIAQGASNSTIAEQLVIAGKTVGNHVSAIFLKLGVATRAEAIVRARDAGMGRIRDAR